MTSTASKDLLLDGRYQLRGHLGAGGMGRVYDAEDLRLGRRVAVKLLAGRGNQDVVLCERLFREARAAASANHPAIVTVFGYGTDAVEGVSYLVMERLEGEDLRARIQKLGRLPVAFVLRLGVELADALAAVHAVDVVHRDIKPSNVFLAQRGLRVDEVKLLDFGVAKVGGVESLTNTGELFGTPTYMAPEQLQDAKRVDARADLYALGATLYECVCGQPVFDGGNAAQVAAQVLLGDIPELRARAPKTPPRLAQLIMRCLARHTVDRPSTARELRDALVALRDG